jgi:probable phosphoglycerate mutase
MTLLVLLRHGATEWTREHRLQGRADLPLAAAGRESVRGWRLPPELSALRWLSSPLKRCTETAALLGLEATIEPRLIEMDWGRWEGHTIAELREERASEVDAMEARGLDLEPPGGESPRQVQRRLTPLLEEIAALGAPTGALTHKGVIRAILALATGWDMTAPEPAKLTWDAVHAFRLGRGGAPSVVGLNQSIATGSNGLGKVRPSTHVPAGRGSG